MAGKWRGHRILLRDCWARRFRHVVIIESVRDSRRKSLDLGSIIPRLEEARVLNYRANRVMFRNFNASHVAAELVRVAVGTHGLQTVRLLWGGPLTEEGLALSRSFAADGTLELGC